MVDQRAQSRTCNNIESRPTTANTVTIHSEQNRKVVIKTSTSCNLVPGAGCRYAGERVAFCADISGSRLEMQTTNSVEGRGDLWTVSVEKTVREVVI